ncbi:fibronectin type III domain-containing protein [[Eubacterium] siraeum]|nr:fibronectin type III domain-containing protein [[Eubacterium] siraeum]
MKVKKWLLSLVTFAAMVVVCAVCAGAETYGDYDYSVRDDGTVEITGYSGSAEKVDIPEKIDGKSVTSIGNYAFSGHSSFTNVTIPNGVTNIGIGAFHNCRKLISISIPNCVTSIGDYAFSSCYGLTRITIPESVKIIGEFVFNDCRNLTNIRIPDSVTSICKGAFSACESLTSITIPDSVTSIGNGVFYGCTSLASITIPNSVTQILEDTFRDCTNLTSVTLPESLTYMGSAFEGCTSLTSITIPNSVTYVDVSAFAGCTSLTEIKVAVENPNYVSVNGVLYNKSRTVLTCYPAGKKDKSYKIINSATRIDNRAFYRCTSLTSITIPDSVTEIGESAFGGCTSLTSITIPDSVMSIARFTFWRCANLKSIKIPNGVTNIGESAFEGCTSLTSVTIPNSVTDIDDSAFRCCTSLTSITIPDSVTEIGWSAFSGCTSLTSITIPDSVTEIEESAFYGCSSLTSITIPASVKIVGEDAFGYYFDEYDDSVKKIDNFKIYCYSGTAGEQYAKDNGFDYELITAEKPAKVTGFKVKSLTSTNVTLQWNKNANASGYEIEQYKSGKWVNVAKITSNATTSYTVKGLAAGTAGYKFRMRAVKDGAYSDYTSVLTVNTNPYGVGGFKCSSKTSTSVTLKWNKGTTASGYQLQQYKDGKWVTIYTGTKATNTSYTVKGLKAGTAGYRFRIRAYKTYGNTKQYGSWSSEVKVNTNPYGVGGFKCSSKTSTSVTLKWNKGTTASGYQLQQYKGGKWVTIYTGTKATNTSFTVKGLKAGTAGYRFRIRAYKTYGNTKQYGSWSSEVKVNTNPYGVGGFKAKSTAKNSITLGWNKGTTASGYQLQQYKGGKWVTVYTSTKATSTSCTVKSLKANTSYKFRIRAYKTYGNTKQYGSWSKVLTVKTKR